MQKTISIFTVCALTALNTSAIRVDTQVGRRGGRRMTQEEKQQWKQYWRTRQADFIFGTDDGEYNKNCTKRAERGWFRAQNHICPNRPTENKRQRCLQNKERKYNQLMELCVNDGPLPDSCAGHPNGHIGQIKTFSRNRIVQHNKRREKHESTGELTFSLDLGCQALTQAKQGKQSGSLELATGPDGNPLQGQNIASRQAVELEADNDWVETLWYDDQIGNYRYSDGTSTGGDIYGFTQVVYDETTEIGCAIQKFDSDDGQKVQFVVCRYASPQIIEDLADHVQCPIDGCPVESSAPEPIPELPASCQALSITSGSDAYNNLIAYNNQRLEEHNEKRALHQDTDALIFDLDLACQAQYWANEHALRANELNGVGPSGQDRLVHYSEVSDTPLVPAQGENLAWRWGSPGLQDNDRWEEEGWYDDEIPSYDFATGTSTGGPIGHFTQMVWDETSSLGCGVAEAEETIQTSSGQMANGVSQYSVCRYAPPGNFIGQFTDHVKPLISS